MPATSRSEGPGPPVPRRYVAIGDSFTAGTERDGRSERWPDELAARLRAAYPELDYLNLAVAGARSEAVARDQLAPTLGLRPDVVTLVCGANDVLLSTRPDIDRYAATFAAMLGRLREGLPEAAIVTATTPNFADFLPLHRRSRRRVAEGMARLAEVTRLVARDQGVVCLEFAAHPQARDRGNFGTDGYHPSPEGNRRAAAAFQAALEAQFGIAAPDPRSKEAA
jgi:phosphatidylinositol alpha 1,6-mannosyltransferase